jgi:hypothetical protein
MRDRCRELSKPDRDDYDRAVICILDDLEALEAALRYVMSVTGKMLPNPLSTSLYNVAHAALDKDARE